MRRGAASGHRLGDRHPAIGQGFTLIELLIVIGIIALVVGLGVPMFGVLTGSRSIEAGQNVVAAAIGQARTVALNEGKYAGLMFYVDPATERTAMTLVTFDPEGGVTGPGLEDPDPFNKYKAFVPGEIYRSPITATDGTVVVGDRAVAVAADVNATFRIGQPAASNAYNPANLTYTRASELFGNLRPTVRVFRAKMEPTAPGGSTFANVPDTAGRRPPRNGPFVVTGTNNYIRIAQKNDTGISINESIANDFSNDNWGQGRAGASITSYGPGGSSGERQLLPLNVGLQLVVQPARRIDDATTAPPERFVRAGVIMFDPQGRLTLERRILSRADTLGKAIGLTDLDAEGLLAGVGVVFYDNSLFRAVAAHTEADWYYQDVPANTESRLRSAYPAFVGIPATAAGRTAEMTEETWLDENAQPLMVNRFSGALSDAAR